MCKLPRLRTIRKAHEVLLAEDPETGITELMLRRLVEIGEIPCVKHGKKLLLDIDTLPDNIVEWVTRQADQAPEKSMRGLPEQKQTGRNYGNVRAI